MTHTVTPAEAGRSLRDLLRNALFLSDGAIRRAKWENRLLRNGAPGRLRDACAAGDVIAREYAARYGKTDFPAIGNP